MLHILAGLHPGGDATVNCQDSRDVLALFLSEAGLQGMLPGDLVQLSGLRVLELDSNSGLFGTWPADLLLPQLVHLDVKVGTGCGTVLQALLRYMSQRIV